MSSLVYTIKKPNDTSLHLPALSYNYIIIFTLFRFIVLNQYLLRSLSGDAEKTELIENGKMYHTGRNSGSRT